MTPQPLRDMNVLRQIEFTEALVRLQGLIGSPIKVTLNFYGEFFGCGLAGELRRVETLPPDDTAISVVIDGGQGFFLDPADTQTFVAEGGEEAGLLEFRLTNGASVAVERADGGGEP